MSVAHHPQSPAGLCTGPTCALLSVHFNNRSIRKTLFRPLFKINFTLDAFHSQLPDEEVLGWYSPVLILLEATTFSCSGYR